MPLEVVAQRLLTREIVVGLLFENCIVRVHLKGNRRILTLVIQSFRHEL